MSIVTPEGKTGALITAPVLPKNCKYYVLDVAELDYTLMAPQPKKNKLMFAEDGHLYCGADSIESAAAIFENMLKTLIVEQSEMKRQKAANTPTIIKPKAPGIISAFPNGMIFRPKSQYHN